MLSALHINVVEHNNSSLLSSGRATVVFVGLHESREAGSRGKTAMPSHVAPFKEPLKAIVVISIDIVPNILLSFPTYLM